MNQVIQEKELFICSSPKAKLTLLITEAKQVSDFYPYWSVLRTNDPSQLKNGPTYYFYL